MGPSKDHAYDEGEKAFQEVRELLRKHYDLQGPYPGMPSISDDKWPEVMENLKVAIQEAIWWQHCRDF